MENRSVLESLLESKLSDIIEGKEVKIRCPFGLLRELLETKGFIQEGNLDVNGYDYDYSVTFYKDDRYYEASGSIMYGYNSIIKR